MTEVRAGDLVKFKGEDMDNPHSAKGIVIDVDTLRGYGNVAVMWDFLKGSVGWNRLYEIEVISASR
jgi:hypothetical protein